MSASQDPEREEKREGIIGEVCETGLDIVDGVLGIGGAILETGGSIVGGAAEIAAGAVEAVGGVAGEAASGCAGCLPVLIVAILIPAGLIRSHLLF
jgi:hypothetical protein